MPRILSLTLAAVWLMLALPAAAQDTTITYQGQLQQNGQPFTGTANLQFQLFDQLIDGNQVGSTVVETNWPVENGLFQVELDFGPAAFDGSERFLEVWVNGAPLSPRQAVRPAPIAVHALNVSAGGKGSTPFSVNPDTGAIEYVFDNMKFRFEPREGTIGGTLASPSLTLGYATNEASGAGSVVSGGGRASQPNLATGLYSVVGGGLKNIANGFVSTVVGGRGNNAAGDYSTVAGGDTNCAGGMYSWAGGNLAFVRPGNPSTTGGICDQVPVADQSSGDKGTFVWAGSRISPFTSTGPDQFLISASGGVGINTNSPSFALSVSGSAGKTGGGSWSVFSDERLKQNIRPLEHADSVLDRLLSLRGYEFEYKTEAIEGNLGLPGRQIGLLAQEVESVFPDWVEEAEDGHLYVTERGTTALFIEALRELRKEFNEVLASRDQAIAQLQVRIARLTSQAERNAELEARLAALENRLIEDQDVAVQP